MRILPLTILIAATVLGQEKPAEKPQVPVQGPPPKNLTKLPDGHFSANTEPKNPENFEIHVVIIGETLSGISRDVLMDGKLWPQIWEQNEHIVNPHWIYPNDKILIKPVTRITEATPPGPANPEEAAAAAPPEEAPPATTPQRRRLVVSPAMAPPAPAGPKSIFNLTPPRVFPEVKEADVYCSGFIRTEDVPRDLKVVARYSDYNEIQPIANTGDYVYLSKGLEGGVTPGATYEVVRPTKAVDTLGMHYLEVAQVQIVIGQSKYSLARVTRGCGAVELGDVLIPYMKTEFPELPSKRPFSGTMRASGQVPGKVAQTKVALESTGSKFSNGKMPPAARGSLAFMDRGVAGEGGVVYLNVGRGEGVKTGDVFIVFRDVPAADLREGNEQARTAIAEVVILRVEEKASTALVTYSADVIGRGDLVERR
jgi:LysM domain